MTGSPWSADNNLRNVLMTFVEKYCHLHQNSHLDYSQQKLKLLICTAMVLIVAKTAKEPERQTLSALSINSAQINLTEYYIPHNSLGSILIALQILE